MNYLTEMLLIFNIFIFEEAWMVIQVVELKKVLSDLSLNQLKETLVEVKR